MMSSFLFRRFSLLLLLCILSCVTIISTVSSAYASPFQNKNDVLRHYRYLQEVSQEEKEEEQNHEYKLNYDVRDLQQDNNSTSNYTDDDICQIILSLTYQSTYEESKQPCTCRRSSDGSFADVNGVNVTIPGTFEVVCSNYQYCTECYTASDTSNEFCGTLYSNFTYYDNTQRPKQPISKDGYDCITIQSSNNGVTTGTNELCLQTFLNTSNTGSSTDVTTRGLSFPQEYSCNIYLNDIMCASCEYVFCNDTAGYPNMPFSQQLSFDCSNLAIDGYTAIMNTCDDVAHNSSVGQPTTFNETTLSDPFLYLSSTDNPYTFESCKNESFIVPTLSTKGNVSSPVSAPVSAPSVSSSTTITSSSLLLFVLFIPSLVI